MPILEAMNDPRLARLRRLAPYRRRQDRECSITNLVESTQKSARRTQSRSGAFTEIWERLVPAEISNACRLGEFRGGVITILVESSSAKYQLDNLLRSSLEVELRRDYPGPLTRVKTRLAPPPRQRGHEESAEA